MTRDDNADISLSSNGRSNPTIADNLTDEVVATDNLAGDGRCVYCRDSVCRRLRRNVSGSDDDLTEHRRDVRFDHSNRIGVHPSGLDDAADRSSDDVDAAQDARGAHVSRKADVEERSRIGFRVGGNINVAQRTGAGDLVKDWLSVFETAPVPTQCDCWDDRAGIPSRILRDGGSNKG